jgi:hypothetical protein
VITIHRQILVSEEFKQLMLCLLQDIVDEAQAIA